MAYRFDGIHLVPVEGSYAAGSTIHRSADRRTIRTELPESGRFEPTTAILYVDVLLEQDERAGIGNVGLSAPVDQMACSGPTPTTFQRMLLIAAGTEVVIGNQRRGGTTVTRLGNSDGELRIVSQDKPAGC